jgi:hypothetical protein
MRTSVLCAMVFCLCAPPAALKAQDPIPNAGFESWIVGEPAGWLSSNYALPGSIAETPDARSGAAALEGKPIEITPGSYASPFLQSQAPGFPVSQRWSSLKGFFKLNSVGQDGIDITVLLYRNGAPVGTGYFTSSISQPEYAEFRAPVVYGVDSIPDLGFIFISMHTGDTIGSYLHSGSMFRLDDLQLSMDSASTCPVLLAGDCDTSGDIKASDIIYLVNYVLKGGADPAPCPASGDTNCDGEVKASDIVNLVNYVFKAGAAPCDVCEFIPGIWSCP